jgi:GT2 family glycosyltransferase
MWSPFASSYTIVRAPLEGAEAGAADLKPCTRYEFWQDDRIWGHCFTETIPDKAAYLRKVTVARADRAAAIVPKPIPPTSLSVIICTRNRPQALEQCLASFAGQTRQPDEIVVVDNGSATDETRVAAVAAGVVYIREDRPGLDFARNAGVARATGMIVAFTDDDVVLHETWCQSMLSAFDSPDIQVVTGLVLPGELTTTPQVTFEREWGFGRGYTRIDFPPSVLDHAAPDLFPPWIIGAGASMAFRREVFDICGDFDLRLGAGASGCSDDSEMWYRVLHHSGTCRYEPSIIAWHYHRKTVGELQGQVRAYMAGNVTSAFIQYERTGRRENLRYLFWTVPTRALMLLARAVVHPRRTTFATLLPHLRGVVAGYLYYARHAERRERSDRRFGSAKEQHS